MFGAFANSIRYAVRRLLGRAFSFAAIVLTIALGAGANVTMYGVLYRLLLGPPPDVARPADLLRIGVVTSLPSGEEIESPILSYPQFVALEGARGQLSAVAAYARTQLGTGDGPQAATVDGVLVSGTYFATLGVKPLLGRLIAPADDDVAEPARVAVLSYSTWKRDFGGRRSAIGSTLRLSSHEYTVIGVLPRGFSGADSNRGDVWIPLAASASHLAGAAWQSDDSESFLQVVARVATTQQLEAAISRIRATRVPIAPSRMGAVVQRFDAAPLWPRSGEHMRRETRVAALLAMTAVLLFVVAIINAANLMLTEAMRRAGEIALRRAIGMNARRLLGMVLSEVCILAVGAALCGAAVSASLNLAIQQSLLANVEWVMPLLSPGAVIATLGASLLACTVSGLAVAAYSTRVNPASALKLAAVAATTPYSRVRRLCIALQMGLSAMLVVGSGLFVKTFWQVQHADLGLSAEKLAILRIESISEPDNSTLREERYREMARRLVALPYVESAALVTEAPLSSSLAMEVSIAGRGRPPFIPTGGPYVNAIGDGALRTLGASIVSGRGFVHADHVIGAERVAIVNQTLARLGWGGDNPIGGCVRLTHDDTCRRVIGVVHDMVRESIVEGPTMQLVVPYEQRPAASSEPVLLLHVRGDVRAAIAGIQHTLVLAGGSAPGVRLRAFRDLVDPQARAWKFGAVLFALFAGLALVIAALGVYSAIATRVEERTAELGIRRAVGAGLRDVAAVIAGRELLWALGGTAAGVCVAALLAPRVITILVRVSPRDASVIAIALVLSVGTGLLATVVPVVRLMSREPSELMRAK